jgi:hypothetical protein
MALARNLSAEDREAIWLRARGYEVDGEAIEPARTAQPPPTPGRVTRATSRVHWCQAVWVSPPAVRSWAYSPLWSCLRPR